jgi:hypothetical protein
LQFHRILARGVRLGALIGSVRRQIWFETACLQAADSKRSPDERSDIRGCGLSLHIAAAFLGVCEVSWETDGGRSIDFGGRGPVLTSIALCPRAIPVLIVHIDSFYRPEDSGRC